MDILEYNARMFNMFFMAMQPPATPESLNQPEEDEQIICDICGFSTPAEDVEYRVCRECREPEDPNEDLGRCVEIMRGERAA